MNKTTDKKKLIFAGRIFAVIALAVTVVGYKPYMKMRAKNAAEEYLSRNYPVIYRQVNLTDMSETTYYRPDEKNMFKEGWWIFYNNPSDDFMYFPIITDKKGNITFDGCSDAYLKGATIYDHYDWEYIKLVKGLMKRGFDVTEMETDDIPPEKMDGSIRFIAGFNPPTGQNLGNIMDYSYDGPVININKKYTTRELGLQYGNIYIAFTGDEPGADRAFRRYLQVKQWVEKNHIPFKTIRIGRDFNECLSLTYDEFSAFENTKDPRANYVVF